MVAYQINEVENGRTPPRELSSENISASSKSMKTQQFQLPLRKRRKRRACILDTHNSIISVLYNSLCRYYLGSSSVVCSSQNPTTDMNLLEKKLLVSAAMSEESFVFLLSLSVSLSLSLCVCVSLSEAGMAISGASVSKEETKFRTKIGTKFRTN
jgi:hypothetical protein